MNIVKRTAVSRQAQTYVPLSFGVISMENRLEELAALLQKREAVRLLTRYLADLPDNPNKCCWLNSLTRSYDSLSRRIDSTVRKLYWNV